MSCVRSRSCATARRIENIVSFLNRSANLLWTQTIPGCTADRSVQMRLAMCSLLVHLVTISCASTGAKVHRHFPAAWLASADGSVLRSYRLEELCAYCGDLTCMIATIVCRHTQDSGGDTRAFCRCVRASYGFSESIVCNLRRRQDSPTLVFAAWLSARSAFRRFVRSCRQNALAPAH